MKLRPEVPLDPLLDVEFDKAFGLMTELVDLRLADKLQPLGPAAVYTTSVVLWMLVYQRMHAGASLEAAVKQFILTKPDFCPDNKRIRDDTLSASTAAYSAGRKRTKREVTQWLANTVSQSIIDTSQPSLRGMRAFLVDGTTVSLPPTPQLQKMFPPASNQHGEGVWPIVNLVVAHELESGAALIPVIGPMYGQEAISETAMIRECVQQFPEKSIGIADAGFGIFFVAHTIHDLGHEFLLRMTKTRFNSLRNQATLVTEGIGSKTYRHRWVPSDKERRKYPNLPPDTHLDVLLHEVKISAETTLFLVTSLPDSATVVTTLYGRRFEIEVEIRDVKVTLDIENIRATTVGMFYKELMTSIVSYNLLVQFRRQAAQLAGLKPKQLSFTKVWNTYRIFLMNAMYTEPEKWRESYRTALYYAMRDKLPNRPGRHFPREAYTKRNKSTQFGKRKKQKKPEIVDEIKPLTPKRVPLGISPRTYPKFGPRLAMILVLLCFSI